MPQPLQKPLTHLTFDSSVVAQNQTLVAELYAAVNDWSKTEGTLGLLLGTITPTRYSTSTVLLNSVVNLTARLQVIKNIASHNNQLSKEEVKKIHHTVDKFRARSGDRTKIVHGIWGVSHDYPNKLLLCKPDDAFRVMSKVFEAGRPESAAISDLQPLLQQWNLKDFQKTRQRINEIQREVINLNNALAKSLAGKTNAQQHPPR